MDIFYSQLIGQLASEHFVLRNVYSEQHHEILHLHYFDKCSDYTFFVNHSGHGSEYTQLHSLNQCQHKTLLKSSIIANID